MNQKYSGNTRCCMMFLFYLFTVSVSTAQNTPLPKAPKAVTYMSPVVMILQPGDTLAGRNTKKVRLVYVVTSDAQTVSLTTLTGKGAVQVEGEIHQRGDATYGQPNGQYALKLKQEPSRHFLGMPKGGKDWILHEAGDFDYSLIRNVMAFNTQRQMGFWAPRTRYFELFVITAPVQKAKPDAAFYAKQLAKVIANPAKYYYGLHINMEKIKVEHHRIDIGAFSYDTTTGNLGGFILQMNQANSEYLDLSTLALTQKARVYEPKKKDLSGQDSAAISSWYLNTSGGGWGGNMQSLYLNYALANGCMTGNAPCFPCPSDSLNKVNEQLWNQVRSTTDYYSMAVYFLMAELARDPDGYHKSTFMYKTADHGSTPGKVYGGPMWDKNKSFGNDALAEVGAACGCAANEPNVYYLDTVGWSYCMSALSQSPVWWETLLLDTQFCRTVKQVWTTYYANNGVLSQQALTSFVQEQATLLTKTGAAQRHYKRWPSAYVFTSEVNKLTKYLKARVKWMDANLDALLLKTSGYK